MYAVVARVALVLLLAAIIEPVAPARAGCGCEKPPPPRAALRPFVAHPAQPITIFADGIVAGATYRIEFRGADGSVDWSNARARWVRDHADRTKRLALEVPVPPLPLGPAAVTVRRDGAVVLALADDEFTVGPMPVPLRDLRESIQQDGYRAAVGRDGTVYLSLDVGAVTAATTFVGKAAGYPLGFGPGDVAMYNAQGYLMQLLDPADEGLFEIRRGRDGTSDALEYWRHEFETYKRDHRRHADKGRGPEVDWHADGSPHVDHDHIVVAIRGTLPDGTTPAPGATAAFVLELESIPAP